MIYTTVTLVALLGFSSLAVDYAHVQLVKTQLQQAADAAARGAVSQLSSGVSATQTAAVTWAGLNTADGTAVVMDPVNDVDFGTWDTTAHTFTLLTGAQQSNANAIRVHARRTAARGTPVTLLFAKMLGITTCDVNATATAYVASSGAYGLVGMSSVSINSGTVTTDSYNASSGAYSAGSAGALGSLASNGGITNGGTTTVSSKLYMQAGQTLTNTGTFNYGSRQATASAIVWPTPAAGTYATTNSNGQLGLPASGGPVNQNGITFTVPPGTYYLSSVSLTNCTFTCSGPVVIYVNGNFTISGGSFTAYNNLPANLAVYIVTAAGVNISNTSALYADVQAPTSPINITNVSAFYGRLVGSQLTVSSSSTTALHVDTSLPAVSGASTPSNTAGGISTVR